MVLFAPNAQATLSGSSDWYGAMIVGTLVDSGGTRIHYDRSLPGLWSTKSIAIPQASPEAVFVNQTTTVTITAQVGADPGLLPSSVQVLQLNAQSQSVAILGNLYDDGTHGDVLPGDGTFTGQFSFSPTSAGTIYLQVVASYSGTPISVLSQPIDFEYFVQPSDADIQAFQQVPISGENYYRSALAQGMTPAQARSATVSYVLQQPGVQAAGTSSDGTSIWIQFTSGLDGVILTNPAGTEGGGLGAPAKGGVIPHLSLGRLCSGFFQMGGAIKYPDNGTAIVAAPFADRFVPDVSDMIANDLSKVCGAGNIQPILNSAVNVNLMKTLNQYATIHINTHGGVDRKGADTAYASACAVGCSLCPALGSKRQ